MNVFGVALAEGTAQLNLTAEEAAATGAVVGFSFGAMAMFTLVWFVFQVIADWKIFTKAGKPGWKSLIPFYNIVVEYDISWNRTMGIVYAVINICIPFLNLQADSENWKVVLFFALGIAALVIHIIQSMKLAKCFEKGTAFSLLLILFGPIARLMLGFGKARYIGKQ
ncbi:MAG: hypothetical protein IJ088_12810 [Clostridia bacterium]|nr:hypothetical protein [Clostridia bacterium]